MSDSSDDIRSAVAEERHYRGDCDSNCSWCNDDEAEEEFLREQFRDDQAERAASQEARRDEGDR